MTHYMFDLIILGVHSTVSDLVLKINTVECLPSHGEALSSNPNTAKGKKKPV
jgi:hypothetical protein